MKLVLTFLTPQLFSHIWTLKWPPRASSPRRRLAKGSMSISLVGLLFATLVLSAKRVYFWASSFFCVCVCFFMHFPISLPQRTPAASAPKPSQSRSQISAPRSLLRHGSSSVSSLLPTPSTWFLVRGLSCVTILCCDWSLLVCPLTTYGHLYNNLEINVLQTTEILSSHFL